MGDSLRSILSDFLGESQVALAGGGLKIALRVSDKPQICLKITRIILAKILDNGPQTTYHTSVVQNFHPLS